MSHDRPVYGASPRQAVVLFWTRYLTFTGRASRSEFWWWTLVSAAVSLVLEIVRFAVLGGSVSAWWAEYSSGDVGGTSLPGNLWLIATVLPTISLTARRLHDTNRTGWWQLIGFLPIVGWVLLLVWCARASDPRGSRYDQVVTTPAAPRAQGPGVRSSE